MLCTADTTPESVRTETGILERVYPSDDDGRHKAFDKTSFPSEDKLQALIAETRNRPTASGTDTASSDIDPLIVADDPALKARLLGADSGGGGARPENPSHLVKPGGIMECRIPGRPGMPRIRVASRMQRYPPRYWMTLVGRMTMVESSFPVAS